MSIFFDLFNPNNRHRTEELRRVENTREEEGQGEPGRGPIDLNSGAVLIRVPNKGQADPRDADPEDAIPQDAAPEDTVSKNSVSENSVPENLADEDAPEDGGAAVPVEEDGGA